MSTYRMKYRELIDASYLAHNEGRYNQAIVWARLARDVAIYDICGTIDHYMVRDCTALVSMNYRTMREQGIN